MYNEFVRNRWPMAFVEINPEDGRSLNVTSGDVVEIFNDYGSTYAMAIWSPPSSGPDVHAVRLFQRHCRRRGDTWTDRNVIPYYKGTWASMRRVGTVSEFKDSVSFKQRRWS